MSVGNLRTKTTMMSSPTDFDKEGVEFWPGIPKIKYEGTDSKNPLAYKYYNPDEVVMGKKMKDWLRFSVCYWHSFNGAKGSDPFGGPTITRDWDDGTNSLENAYRRAGAAFEFMDKLGVEYFTFHDVDVAPEGETLEETQSNLDKVIDKVEGLMKKTGIKLLWATQNMFSNTRYMNGAATNPEVHNFAYASA